MFDVKFWKTKLPWKWKSKLFIILHLFTRFILAYVSPKTRVNIYLELLPCQYLLCKYKVHWRKKNDWMHAVYLIKSIVFSSFSIWKCLPSSNNCVCLWQCCYRVCWRSTWMRRMQCRLAAHWRTCLATQCSSLRTAKGNGESSVIYIHPDTYVCLHTRTVYCSTSQWEP